MVAKARSGAMGSHLRLVTASDGAGTAKTARGDAHGELRSRVVARQDGVHVTNGAICGLLARSSRRLRRSQLVTLEEIDGVPAIVPLSSL